MKEALRHRLERLTQRLPELDAALADPQVMRSPGRLRELSQEHAQVSALAELYRQYRASEAAEAGARQLLEDADLAQEARDEIARCEARRAELTQALQQTLLPRDSDDARNAFVEIRAGTGGDESALFAADLARMYTRYAERRGWRCEVISASESDLGGYKEVVLHVQGDPDAQGRGVYGELRFESGGHRVQRIPVTETQGRIHTSACTVAVLPEADAEQEVHINPADLRIDTFRASGAGGQHINKTDSAVRITHLPTGIVAECQDDRSQHRNKAQALAVLAARIRDKERSERQAQEAATRKSLIGSGDRSERIRTYNFPQNRLTDHRIGLTLYNLPQVMEGAIDDIIAALQKADYEEKLAALTGRSFVPMRFTGDEG